MSRFDWMLSLSFPSGGHPVHSEPGSIQIDGRPFVVATNGYALTAVEGESEFDSASGIEGMINGWFRELHENGVTIDFASLKAWAGKPSIVKPSECERCGGSQKITCTECNGTRRTVCECPWCDHEHTKDCDTCIDGMQTCPGCSTNKLTPARPGMIDGWPFNMELLARYVAGIEAKTALIRVVSDHDHGKLYLGDHDWFVAVMGLRGVDLETVTERWNSKEAVVAS